MLSVAGLSANPAWRLSPPVRAELVEAVFTSRPHGLPTSRGLPGGNSLSFASPKESKQRKGDPAVCVPLRLRYGGNLRCSVQPGPGSNSPSAQTIARPDPSGPALLGAYRRVVGAEAQSGSGEDVLCASSPPRIRICIRFPHPSGRAEEHSRKWIRASDCLSAASSSSTPLSASTAGCPAAQRRGPGPSGRLSFGYFSLATQRKVPRPPGRDPACWQSTFIRITQTISREARIYSSWIPGAWLGMGCKAQFEANSRSYWQKLQRRRPPKPSDRGPRGINPRFPCGGSNC